MHQLVFEISMIVALCATGLAAAVMAWNGVSVWGIAFRALVSGGVVFFFTFFAAHLLSRSVLAEIAREELERKKLEEEKQREMVEHGDDTPIPPGFFGSEQTESPVTVGMKSTEVEAADGRTADARTAAQESDDAEDVAQAA